MGRAENDTGETLALLLRRLVLFCRTQSEDGIIQIKWARAATRHRIGRERSRYVIEHCGLRFREAPPADATPGISDERLLYLGDDAEGVPLEVMAVELESGDLLVIHAMPLREKYRKQYEEAKQWQR